MRHSQLSDHAEWLYVIWLQNFLFLSLALLDRHRLHLNGILGVFVSGCCRFNCQIFDLLVRQCTMRNPNKKLIEKLEAQQKEVATLTAQIGELNLGISNTLNQLKEESSGKPAPSHKKATIQRSSKFQPGDVVEVLNKYKGAQGNLKGKKGTVQKVGPIFVTIDIPELEGTTDRIPRNLKLVSKATEDKATVL